MPSVNLKVLIGAIITLLLVGTQLSAQTKRITSIKSLTHVLSQIEKENGEKAKFVTMKLQIYLEDIYISQGSAVYLKSRLLSKAIMELLKEGKTKQKIARDILRRYQKGEFHE